MCMVWRTAEREYEESFILESYEHYDSLSGCIMSCYISQYMYICSTQLLMYV